MTLDRDDIQAIAAEVVRQIRQMEEVTLDAEHLASSPDFKTRQQQKMREHRAALKAAKH